MYLLQGYLSLLLVIMPFIVTVRVTGRVLLPLTLEGQVLLTITLKTAEVFHILREQSPVGLVFRKSSLTLGTLEAEQVRTGAGPD